MDIDYANVFALTVYGKIGVKVWICKGEVLTKRDLNPNFVGGKTDVSDRRERRDEIRDREDRGRGGERRARWAGGGERRGGGGGGRKIVVNYQNFQIELTCYSPKGVNIGKHKKAEYAKLLKEELIFLLVLTV